MSVLVKEISEQEVRGAVTAQLGTVDFELKEFKVQPASENPLGFMGDHVRIIVTILSKGETQKTCMFVKKLPSMTPSHYDYVTGTKVFYKEIELYKTLLRDIKNSVSKNRESKIWLPEFYFSRDWELIIMQDLSADGYYMIPERAVMDFEHIKAAIESMAAMHAGSLIFEEKLNEGKATTLSDKISKSDKQTIRDLYSNVTFETDASDIKGHPGNMFWEAGFRSQVSLIDLLPDLTSNQKEIIKSSLVVKLRKVFDFVKPSNMFKNVLIHGDLWANNMMFRKDDKGNISNCIFLDFQLARYGPPAHDLTMFLHLVQTRNFRRQHENHLLDFYYSALASELGAEGLQVENILPKHEFEESIRYYREYAILSSVMYFQIILVPGEIAYKFLSLPELLEKNMLEDRSELIKACYQEDENCRNRMTQAMRELIEFYGWL